MTPHMLNGVYVLRNTYRYKVCSDISGQVWLLATVGTLRCGTAVMITSAFHNLTKLVNGDVAEGIDEFAWFKSLTCEGCLAASSTELPFPCWAREKTRQRHCISFLWMFVGHSWTTTRRCHLFAQLLASRRCLHW